MKNTHIGNVYTDILNIVKNNTCGFIVDVYSKKFLVSGYIAIYEETFDNFGSVGLNASLYHCINKGNGVLFGDINREQKRFYFYSCIHSYNLNSITNSNTHIYDIKNCRYIGKSN